MTTSIAVPSTIRRAVTRRTDQRKSDFASDAPL
jgi:hypothetical protein